MQVADVAVAVERRAAADTRRLVIHRAARRSGRRCRRLGRRFRCGVRRRLGGRLSRGFRRCRGIGRRGRAAAVFHERHGNARQVEATHAAGETDGVAATRQEIDDTVAFTTVVAPAAGLFHAEIVSVARRVAAGVHLGGRTVRGGVIDLEQRLAAAAAVDAGELGIRPADVQVVDGGIVLGRAAARRRGIKRIGGHLGVLRQRFAGRAGVVALHLTQRGHALARLFDHANGAVVVEIEAIHTDRAQCAVAGDGAVVIEQIPVALVQHHRAVGGVASGALEHHAARGPRAERAVGGGIAHAVLARRVVGIHEIIRVAALEHPGGLVEVLEPHHRLHLAVERHHVVAELAAHAHGTAADVDIAAAVVILEHAGIDERIVRHIPNVALIHKAACRRIAGSHADLPGAVPRVLRRMGIIEVIRAVLIRRVRRPHEAADTPVEIARTQDLALIVPIDHVVGREDVIGIHQIAAARREHVVRRIEVDLAVLLPHMGGGVGGEHRADDGVARLFAGIDVIGQLQPVDVEVAALDIQTQRLLARRKLQRARLKRAVGLPAAGRAHVTLGQRHVALLHIDRSRVVRRREPQPQLIRTRFAHVDAIVHPVARMGITHVAAAVRVAAILDLHAVHRGVILRFDAHRVAADLRHAHRLLRLIGFIRFIRLFRRGRADARSLDRLAGIGAADRRRVVRIDEFEPVQIAVAALEIEAQRLLARQQREELALKRGIGLPAVSVCHVQRRLRHAELFHRHAPGAVRRRRPQPQPIAAARRDMQRVIHPVAAVRVPHVTAAVRVAAILGLHAVHRGIVLRLDAGRARPDTLDRRAVPVGDQLEPVEVKAALRDIEGERLLARRERERPRAEAIPHLPAAGLADRDGGEHGAVRRAQLRLTALVGRRGTQPPRVGACGGQRDDIGRVVAAVDEAQLLAAVLAALDLHALHGVIALGLHTQPFLLDPRRAAPIHPRRIGVVVEIGDRTGIEHVRHRDVVPVRVKQLLPAVRVEQRVDEVHPRVVLDEAEVFDKVKEVAVVEIERAALRADKAFRAAPAGDVEHIHRTAAIAADHNMVRALGRHIILFQRHDLRVDERHGADRVDRKGGNARIHALTQNPAVRQPIAARAGLRHQTDAVAAGEGEVVIAHLLFCVADGEHLGMAVQALLHGKLTGAVGGRVCPRAVFRLGSVVEAAEIDLQVADHAAARAAADANVVVQRHAREIFHIVVVTAVGHQIHAVIDIAQRYVDDVDVRARAAHAIGIRGRRRIAVLRRLVKDDAADAAVFLQRHGRHALGVARAAVHLKDRAELDGVAPDVHRALQLHAGGDGQRPVEAIVTGRQEHHAAALASREIERRLDEPGRVGAARSVRLHHIEILASGLTGVVIVEVRHIGDRGDRDRLVVHRDAAGRVAGQSQATVKGAAGEDRVHALAAQRHLRAGRIERTRREGGHTVVELHRAAADRRAGHVQADVAVVIERIARRVDVHVHHLQQTVRIARVALHINAVFAAVEPHRRDRLAAGAHARDVDAVLAVGHGQLIALAVRRAAGVDGRFAETQTLAITGDVRVGQIRPVDAPERHADRVLIEIVPIGRIVRVRRAGQSRFCPVIRREEQVVEPSHVHDAVHVHTHLQRRAVDVAQRRAHGHLSAADGGGDDADVGVDQRDVLHVHIIRAPDGGIARADRRRIGHDVRRVLLGIPKAHVPHAGVGLHGHKRRAALAASSAVDLKDRSGHRGMIDRGLPVAADGHALFHDQRTAEGILPLGEEQRAAARIIQAVDRPLRRRRAVRARADLFFGDKVGDEAPHHHRVLRRIFGRCQPPRDPVRRVRRTRFRFGHARRRADDTLADQQRHRQQPRKPPTCPFSVFPHETPSVLRQHGPVTQTNTQPSALLCYPYMVQKNGRNFQPYFRRLFPKMFVHFNQLFSLVCVRIVRI